MVFKARELRWLRELPFDEERHVSAGGLRVDTGRVTQHVKDFHSQFEAFRQSTRRSVVAVSAGESSQPKASCAWARMAPITGADP